MIYRKLLLRYLNFRKKNLEAKILRCNEILKDIQEQFLNNNIHLPKYTRMINYNHKTLDSLNGQYIELNNIINHVDRWHIAKKQKKNS